LRTDNQAVTWLKTNQHLNKMRVRWLGEIEDFRFVVTHRPGARNLTEPDGPAVTPRLDGPAASTGDPDPESHQELFSRRGRDTQASALRRGTQSPPRGLGGERRGGGGAYPPGVLVCSV